MLKIQQFIKDHIAWETIIANKPYCIQVSRDKMFGHNLVMFKYSQIDSDFHDLIVRECRGLILDEDTLEPICVPFFKFHNAGEPCAATIDWKTARCGEKIDGSLVKIVRLDGDLLISTNGTIDAFKAPVAEQIGCKYKSFGDIAKEVLNEKHIEKDMFDEGFTYMFELVSPWTKVVIPHNKNDLYFLGKRDNKTFEETYFTDDKFAKLFKTPRLFKLSSIDECLTAAKNLPWDDEGYVVCDAKFNRIKVKSPQYCAMHHLKGNGVMSVARAVDLARANEIDEVLSYFPEFKTELLNVKAKYDALVKEFSRLDVAAAKWLVDNGYDKEPKLVKNGGADRKKLAMWAFKETKHPNVIFGLIDKKYESSAEWLKTVKAEMIVNWLGLKNN